MHYLQTWTPSARGNPTHILHGKVSGIDDATVLKAIEEHGPLLEVDLIEKMGGKAHNTPRATAILRHLKRLHRAGKVRILPREAPVEVSRKYTGPKWGVVSVQDAQTPLKASDVSDAA